MISFSEAGVAQILVRNIDSDVKAKLRARARRHGRSTEEEVREILRSAVKGEGGPSRPLGTRIKARFARIGLDEDIPELRGQPARPADLGS
jgi:plasmid stability protein